MIEVRLSELHVVQMRGPDELLSGDRDAVNASLEIPISMSQDQAAQAAAGQEVGGQLQVRLPVGMMEAQRNALLAQVITGWTLDLPLPGQDPSVNEFGQRVYADSLRKIPLVLWWPLEDAIAPHLRAIRRQPDPKGTTTASSNGTLRAAPVPVSPTA